MFFNLFKRKKERPHSAPQAPGRWEEQQRIWADYLQQRTQRWSPKGRKVVALLFLFLLFGWSLWILAGSFRRAFPSKLPITPIKTVPLAKPVEGLTFQEAKSEKELQRLHSLKAYEDSLVRLGRAGRDTLFAPGKPFFRVP